MDPLFNLGIVFIIYAIVIGGVGYFVVKFFNRIQNPYNIKIAQIVDRIYLAPKILLNSFINSSIINCCNNLFSNLVNSLI